MDSGDGAGKRRLSPGEPSGGHLVRKWPRSQDGDGAGDPGRRGASAGAVSVASAVYTATEAVSSPANSASSFCSLNPGLHKLQSFTETPRMFPTSPNNLCPSLRHIFPTSTHRFLFYKMYVWRGGGMNWEPGTGMHTPLILRIKYITNEELLYSSGNSVLCGDQNEKEVQKRGDMCKHTRYAEFTLL